MAIKFACPYCDKISSVPDSFAGKKGKCPACQKVIEVPDPNEGVEPEPSSKPSSPRRASDSGGAEGENQDCPFCGESIKKVAKKCKFCGEFLDKGLKRNRGGSRGPKPDNHLALAIISTICIGCLPLGIVSIIYAVQVDGKYNQGDYRGAVDASEKAKTYGSWSLGIGLVLMVLNIVMTIAAR